MKKLLLIIFLFLPYLVFAHSGRLDSNGGHKVNKRWVYEGKYIEIKNNQAELKEDRIVFSNGDYHYHCKPSINKINLTTFRDGIYIPADRKTKSNAIDNVKIDKDIVIGNINNNKYYKPNSPYLKWIGEKDLIIFHDKYEAEENGFKPCEE